jgi:hypothetical protein
MRSSIAKYAIELESMLEITVKPTSEGERWV